MQCVKVLLQSEKQTCLWARTLASYLPQRMWIALIGPLGAGKTRIVQHLAAAAGIPPHAVTSPTFVLCQTYDSGLQRIIHVDAYRIGSHDEWWELGAAEWEEQSAWVLVEWADRVLDCFPDDYLLLELEIAGPTERWVRLEAHGAQAAEVVERMADWPISGRTDVVSTE
ncbi:MAG: hypothetical protein KatS3mg110_4293 [Pirellulaceae bacterium]|nr:MAG: hypothetical protein KatS3mg110_4293 [Pirellulaceae bacterium]